MSSESMSKIKAGAESQKRIAEEPADAAPAKRSNVTEELQSHRASDKDVDSDDVPLSQRPRTPQIARKAAVYTPPRQSARTRQTARKSVGKVQPRQLRSSPRLNKPTSPPALATAAPSSFNAVGKDVELAAAGQDSIGHNKEAECDVDKDDFLHVRYSGKVAEEGKQARAILHDIRGLVKKLGVLTDDLERTIGKTTAEVISDTESETITVTRKVTTHDVLAAADATAKIADTKAAIKGTTKKPGLR